MDVPAATRWVDERLAAAGARRTGDLRLFRERTWASVFTVASTGGPVWLKATTPDTAAEVRLYEVLAEVVPDRILVPLGADPDRGWLLLPDAGPSLADTAGADDTARVDGLADALRDYAGVQQRLAPHVDRLLAAGLADMRPAGLPQRFAEALAAVEPWLHRHGTAEDRETARRLADFAPQFAESCETLAAAGPPASIDHNDLHPANVIGTAAHRRFYDWGDSVVAHPYASLLTPTDSAPDTAAATLRTAYLDAWDDPGGAATAATVCRLSRVARALIWQRALGPDALDGDHAGAPLRQLRRVLPS